MSTTYSEMQYVKHRRRQIRLLCNAERRMQAGDKAPNLTIAQCQLYMNRAKKLGVWR